MAKLGNTTYEDFIVVPIYYIWVQDKKVYDLDAMRKDLEIKMEILK